VFERDISGYSQVPSNPRFLQPGAFGKAAESACARIAEQSIARRFEEQVVANADRLAVRTDSVELTYSELNILANRQAHALRALDVRSEQPVAILLGQGAAFVGALLGVLKAGGCFVPLDLVNPPGRNLQMLLDSGARILMTSSEHLTEARSIAAGCCEVLDVDRVSVGDSHNPDVAVAADHLACILFTSGSTGMPKGVMHDHRSLVHNAMRHREAFRITPEDRQTLLYTCSVYGGIRDIFNALLSGASLHTFGVRKRGVDGLAQWLRASRITIYCSVATVFRQLADTLTSREVFSDLRVVKLGGEAAHRRDVELFRSHFPTACALHCGFGSTETGVTCHFFIDAHTSIDGDAVPLGYAATDMDVLLLNDEGEQVAAGDIGEIVIRSRFISRGYWRRPDLNEKVFGCDRSDARIRTYRTGDLGVLRADGCLEHRGRKDGQIKIRGNRVEIAEIEMALRSISSVAHAVVIARRDEQAESYLVAYFVPRGEPLSISEVRRGLAERLPEHMIPTAFVQLESLPQTPNGKVDRLGLPTPGACRPQLEKPYVAPRSTLEQHLAVVWSNLLGIERIGVQDDFFELGGSSLAATRLMARIRADHGQILPLALLFEARTVAALADVIARGHERSSWSPIVPIHPRGRRHPLFCVHPGGGNVLGYQEFTAHLHPDQPVYGIQAYGVVEGQTPHSSVRQMALQYIKAMREIQPAGPYYLGGESFGGIVAYEMACQLVQGGERVAFLFVGDAWPKTIQRWRYLRSCLTYPLQLTRQDWMSLFRKKVLRQRELRVPVKRYLYADNLHRANSLAHREASTHYVPRRYPGVLTLFRALERNYQVQRQEHYFGGPDMGWRTWATDVAIHWMPDTHREMMHGPNARGFAEKLQACLNRAHALEAACDATCPAGIADSTHADDVGAESPVASGTALTVVVNPT
jgi:amino acid adenylation domain-containing protein